MVRDGTLLLHVVEMHAAVKKFPGGYRTTYCSVNAVGICKYTS